MTIFNDRTAEIHKWNEDMNSLKLPRIRNACNRNFLPLVLCPFGCSEFSSETGKILLELVSQRYLLQTRLKMMNKCQAFKYVKWVRDGYIRMLWEYD